MRKFWYAVYTKPRNEKRVAELLSLQGIENYLPLIKSIRQWSDRKKLVELPLFTSYIFVHIHEKQYYDARKVPGIVKFVTFENRRIVVPEYQIEAIRKYVETGEDITIDTNLYTIGKLVRVAHGNMKGLQGILVEILGKQRVKVEIEGIRQTLFIKIPLSILEIIGENKDEEIRYW